MSRQPVAFFTMVSPVPSIMPNTEKELNKYLLTERMNDGSCYPREILFWGLLKSN